MSDKRLVHEILSETDGRGQQRRPVAFIQHGNKEDGFTYEGVCPFCGITTVYVEQAATRAIGGLYRLLLIGQKKHWPDCKGYPRRDFAVEITKKPLNVEKPLKLGGDDGGNADGESEEDSGGPRIRIH